MNAATPDNLVKNEIQVSNLRPHLSKLVVKEILRTEITPVPPEVRLDHWRHKMEKVKPTTKPS